MGARSNEAWLCKFCKDFVGKPFRNNGSRTACVKCSVAKGAAFLAKCKPASPSQPSSTKTKGQHAPWAQSREVADLTQKNVELQKQIAKLRKATHPGSCPHDAGSVDASGTADLSSATVDDCQRAYDLCLKAFGADGAASIAAKAELDTAKKSRAEAKPLHTQILAAERRAKATASAVDAIKARVEKLLKQLFDEKATLADKEAEATAAGKELEDLRAKLASGSGAQATKLPSAELEDALEVVTRSAPKLA